MPCQPNQPSHVLLAVNPQAGARSRREMVEHLELELRRCGLTPEIVADAAQLPGRAGELHAAGELRAVVAAGGDGTFRLVAENTPP
ncbi:MAG TPA: diacylglycerol kinase family protein, partial [Pirellulaceae bacterium]|nr:diacylglycerol kinase family protein [Pirellulaceae bacterium]